MATAYQSVTAPDTSAPRRRQSALTAEHEKIVSRVVFAAKAARQDVDDVEQAVREELLRRLPTYRPESGVPIDGFLWPYLLGAARHAVRKDPHVRAKYGKTYEVPLGSPADLDTHNREFVMGPDHDPRAADAVRDYIRTLPPITRYVVVRHYYYELTFAEIGVELGMTRQSVYNHHQRALKMGLTALAQLREVVAA